jgi:hypothetical protein
MQCSYKPRGSLRLFAKRRRIAHLDQVANPVIVRTSLAVLQAMVEDRLPMLCLNHAIVAGNGE